MNKFAQNENFINVRWQRVADAEWIRQNLMQHLAETKKAWILPKMSKRYRICTNVAFQNGKNDTLTFTNQHLLSSMYCADKNVIEGWSAMLTFWAFCGCGKFSTARRTTFPNSANSVEQQRSGVDRWTEMMTGRMKRDSDWLRRLAVTAPTGLGLGQSDSEWPTMDSTAQLARELH